MLLISKLLKDSKLGPLTKSRTNLCSIEKKILAIGRKSLVQDRQAKLLNELWNEKTRIELDEIERIREASLAPAFDELEKLSFFSRTSSKNYKISKTAELKKMMRTTEVEKNTENNRQIYRTFDLETNVTVSV